MRTAGLYRRRMTARNAVRRRCSSTAEGSSSATSLLVGVDPLLVTALTRHRASGATA
jgi:hypothetical protein